MRKASVFAVIALVALMAGCGGGSNDAEDVEARADALNFATMLASKPRANWPLATLWA